MKIEKMTLTDLNTIKEILSTEFDNFWNYNILEEELSSSNSYYIVCKLNNEVIGFAGIKFSVDSADIMNIVTKKQYRNKGIATLLLKNLISICSSKNIHSLFLEVNENNKIAIHLYTKLNFKQISIRKNYYQNESGIIMLLSL